MLTGDIRSQVDQVWNAFWAGGVSAVLPFSVPPEIRFFRLCHDGGLVSPLGLLGSSIFVAPNGLSKKVPQLLF